MNRNEERRVTMMASVKKLDDGMYEAMIQLLDKNDDDDVRSAFGAIGKGLSPTFAVQDAMKKVIDFIEESAPIYRTMREKVGETGPEVDPVVMAKMADNPAEAVN